MIKKELKIIITFRTTTEAMSMEQMCKEQKLDGRIIPVPKSITAGCGLAWCAKLKSRDVLKNSMLENGIEAEGIYECLI